MAYHNQVYGKRKDPPSVTIMSIGFDYQILIKVVCIGNSGVGKSSLALRFCSDEWDPSFKSTVGVDFKYRIVDVDGCRMRLFVWDTAGQDRFRAITKAYYRGCEGVLLVYDISDYPSFEGIQRWANDVNNAGVPDTVPRLLVGNKTDSSNRAVSVDQGRSLAEKMGAQFCETSAKHGDGVTEAFMMLARAIKKRMDTDPVYRSAVNDKGNSAFGPTRGKRLVGKPDPKSWYGGCGCSSDQCVGYYTEEEIDVDR